MESWIKISLFLCLFGFLKEFRPSEPFIVDFLLSDRVNLTDEVINQEIFPTGTYCNCIWLVLVLLATDLLRYKPIIILEAIGGIGCWALLSFSTNYVSMIMAQVMYGLFIATEVAYFTYMYAIVDREHYQQVTSHTRTAYLLGRSLSGVLAQLFMSTNIMDSHQLNYLTLGSLCLATVWAILLPPAKENVYFRRISQGSGNEASSGTKHHVQQQTSAEMVVSTQPLPSDTDTMTYCQRCGKIYTLLWRDFVAAFTNWYVVKWSIWWALATCGYLQRCGNQRRGRGVRSSMFPEHAQTVHALSKRAPDNSYLSFRTLPMERIQSACIVGLLFLGAAELSRGVVTIPRRVNWGRNGEPNNLLAFMCCNRVTITTYVQLLYETILEENKQDDNELYNGAVEALSTLLGACATLACSWLKVDWRTNGETALALCSLVEAAILFVSSQSQVMWLAYFCYVMFVVVYYAMFTITKAEQAVLTLRLPRGRNQGSYLIACVPLLNHKGSLEHQFPEQSSAFNPCLAWNPVCF
uniref:Reduced folate carrier n=1 Tax=Timema bartmani TaxID=61472 RepID=A0A7R9I221_9NEOP|nr:unnamed protein product [Timema bartmani]